VSRTIRCFLAGAILAACVLLSSGAPPLAVAGGIAVAALFMRRISRAL